MRKIYLLLFSFLFISAIETKAQPGNYLSYDGSFNFLTMPPNIVTNLTGDFTIEAWVFWRGGSPTWGNTLQWQRIFDFGNDQNNYVFLTPQSNYNSKNGVMFAITEGGTAQVIQSSTPLPMNVWTHVAVTVDNATNTGNMFVNGILDATATNTSFTFRPGDLGNTVNDWLGKSEFAGSPAFDPYFNGGIDELRISNSVRYTADFTPIPVQFPVDGSTTALFHFNEGSGQTTADATTNFPDAILGTDATVDAVTDPTWATGSVLPIRLIDFSATLNQVNRTVDVKWIASLDAASEFVVERSSNGTNFTPVYTLNRPNGSTGFENFSFRDASPLGGRSYYRLKCTEVGSAPVYSRIIPVSFASRETLVIYPNPVRGNLINIELAKPYSGDVEMKIYNSGGVAVYSQKIHAVNQREFQIARNTIINAGNYLVEVTVNGIRQTKMIVCE